MIGGVQALNMVIRMRTIHPLVSMGPQTHLKLQSVSFGCSVMNFSISRLRSRSDPTTAPPAPCSQVHRTGKGREVK